MKKIIKKVNNFYDENKEAIKITACFIGGAIFVSTIKSNLRINGELRDLKKQIGLGLVEGNNSLIESQSIVRGLVESGKNGTEEWHNEVVNSAYLLGCLEMLNTVGNEVKKIK